jgi:flagellar hook-length control protein FliK
MTTINLLVETATSSSTAAANGTSGGDTGGDFTGSLHAAHGRAAEGAPRDQASATVDTASDDSTVKTGVGRHVWQAPEHAVLVNPGISDDGTAPTQGDKQGKQDAPDTGAYAWFALLHPMPAPSAAGADSVSLARHPAGTPSAASGAHAALPGNTPLRVMHGRTDKAPPPKSELTAAAPESNAHHAAPGAGTDAPEPAWLDQLKAVATSRNGVPDHAALVKADNPARLHGQVDRRGATQAVAKAHAASSGDPHASALKSAGALMGQPMAANPPALRTVRNPMRNDDHIEPAPNALAAITTNHHGGMQAGSANAASPSLALAPPVGSTPWQQELGQQMVRMLQRGEHHVELKLNPRELGPLSISLHVDHHGAQAQFLAAHADVREAVQQAIPQLREALAQHGIALGEAMVGQQQQQAQHQHNTPARSESLTVQSVADTAPHASASTAAGHTAQPRSPRGGLDLYA